MCFVTTGDLLEQKLRGLGLLEPMAAGAGDTHMLECTRVGRVRALLVNVAYVIVKAARRPPYPLLPGPLCTCSQFCRYAGCEHVEFIKMLDLRLRAASSFPEALPVLRTRGRKPGTRLTQRSEAKAAAKPRVRKTTLKK